jgi:hypothetical protein
MGRGLLPGSAATALAPVLAALLFAPGALAAPAVVRGTVASEADGVKAVVEYTRLIPDPGPGRGRAALAAGGGTAEHLTIARDGQQIYSQPVTSQWCKRCNLEEFPTAPMPLAVADLEGGGEPDVVLHLYTGGAHCCTIVQVLHFDPATMTYALTERDFGDPGARIAALSGAGPLYFQTADDRFGYEFAPFAYSGLPLLILAFREGRFVDVTRGFPEALRKDAARWLRAFRASRDEGLGNGAIAAWAADEELLEHGALVRATLSREARFGHLRSRERYGPSGKTFAAALMRFLHRTGYR